MKNTTCLHLKSPLRKRGVERVKQLKYKKAKRISALLWNSILITLTREIQCEKFI